MPKALFSRLVTAGVLLAATVLTPATALAGPPPTPPGGNFVASGHDMDFHCAYGDPNECSYLKIVLDKVRNGSTLPILALDQGTEAGQALTNAGYGGQFTSIDPTSAAFASTPFVDPTGHPLYSAVVTASDSTCGGCDNTPDGETAINSRATDFSAYFNAGGGILALAGADNYATYYNFVPLKIAGTAVAAPFTVTPDGAALGITGDMANCCPTHNSFTPPSSPFVTLETDYLGQAETIAAFNATIGGGGFVPGPATDPAITAAGSSVSATEGKALTTAPVATITDPDTAATAAEYTATVNWGDGSTESAGTVSGPTGGPFSVTGSHTYAEEGHYTVTTTITDTTDTTNGATATGSATVTDAALTSTGATLTSTQSFSGPVASFTDADPAGVVGDYTATITWGDGTPATAGTISGAGPFSVNGAHTYAATGPYTVTVHIADAGGASTDTTSHVLVYAFATASGASFTIGDATTAVGSPVQFWGSQWAKANTLSGGTAPAAFKGFAATPSGTAPTCGGSYTTAPGNSATPPNTLPAYLGVFVSSKVNQAGSTISGNIVHLVVVATNTGYAADPGHPGTGTVVTTVC